MKKILSLLGMLAFSLVHAQNRGEIVIGTSLPLTGFNAAVGQEGLAVMTAYFDHVNKTGGIQGRPVAILALDDEFKPEKAAENARKLAAEGAVAIFNCWGTSSCSAMMPVINEYKLPLFAGIAGGGPMRTAPGRYAFNVRPGTGDELARIVRQMKTIGQTNISVLYQNDGFGKSAFAAAKDVLAADGVKSSTEIALAADASDVQTAFVALKTASPNGVILLGSPVLTTKLITHLRQNAMNLPVYNLAAQANRNVVGALGEHTSNVIFTTLVPNPWRTSVPIVKEYQQIYGGNNAKAEFSYVGLEVFINAKLLIDGLKQAGSKATREGLVEAFETMGLKNFGDAMAVKYGAQDREGSSYVGLTIVNRQGRFME